MIYELRIYRFHEGQKSTRKGDRSLLRQLRMGKDSRHTSLNDSVSLPSHARR